MTTVADMESAANPPNGTPAERLRIAILLPSYNEALTIRRTVENFRAALPQAISYVYDNNSSDDTGQVALSAGAVVRREPLQGKGHVVRRMFADIEADIYVMSDADNTYDAAAAGRLVARLIEERLDMVVGSRAPSADPRAYRRGHRLGPLFRRNMRTSTSTSVSFPETGPKHRH